MKSFSAFPAISFLIMALIVGCGGGGGISSTTGTTGFTGTTGSNGSSGTTGTSGSTGTTGTVSGSIGPNFFATLEVRLNARSAKAEPFNITSTTKFVFYGVAQYSGSLAIVTPDTVQSFVQFGAYQGYAIQTNQSGYATVTLGPGSYYLGARNASSSSANSMRIELDLADHTTGLDRIDYYVQGVKSVANGGKLWQPFEIQSDIRYFIDGCNTALDTFVIEESQLSGFTSDSGFQYFQSYSGEGAKSLPGGSEYRLPVGQYYLCFRNNTGEPQSVAYLMARYRNNRSVGEYNIERNQLEIPELELKQLPPE